MGSRWVQARPISCQECWKKSTRAFYREDVSPSVGKQPYHAHLLHLAHELDEDPVEDLADAG